MLFSYIHSNNFSYLTIHKKNSWIRNKIQPKIVSQQNGRMSESNEEEKKVRRGEKRRTFDHESQE